MFRIDNSDLFEIHVLDLRSITWDCGLLEALGSRSLIQDNPAGIKYGRKGECPCCQEWKDLTEHHVKEVGNANIMVSVDYHRRIEENLKVLDKFRNRGRTRHKPWRG